MIKENLYPRVREAFTDLGFVSDNGVRFFCRNNDLVHFYIFSVDKYFKGMCGVRTDGNRLEFSFGEFLTYAPNVKVLDRDHLYTSKRMRAGELLDPILFEHKKHFKKASDKIIEAVKDIEKNRSSLIYTEQDYEDYHLRGSASLEKVYYLTAHKRHQEADAWLHLMTHKYRGLYGSISQGNLKLQYKKPSEQEVEFSQLSYDQRIKYVENLRSHNIKANQLEYLYEAV